MKFLLAFWLLASLVLAANAQTTSQMTHEETVVRTAYAKLSFATEQVAVTQLALEATGLVTPKKFAGQSSDQRIADAQLNVTLGDFVVGNAQDVLSRKATDLITPAVNEKLYIQDNYHSYLDKGQEYQWLEPNPKWVPADPIPPGVLNLTLGNFLELEWHQKQQWQTYASYTVTVSYQGKSAGPYKALFLFGHDTKGAEIVAPEDGTIDAVLLGRVMQKRLFADAFLSERLWKVPLVKDWVTAKQQSLNCSPEQGVCCDLASLRCGPDQARVEKAQKGGVE